MREPIYGQALSRALQLVLRHKIIWVFGVLSLLLGQLGWDNFIGGLAIFSSDRLSLNTYLMSIPWGALVAGQNLVWSAWLFIIVAAVSILVILMAIASEGALVAAATTWFKGGKALKMEEAWRKGIKHFKRLFGLHVLKKGLMVGLLLGVNGIINSLPDGETFAVLFPVIIVVSIGVFFALTVSSIGLFAAGYIVEKELPLIDSIKEGTNLFFEHLLVSLELSLLLLAIHMGVVLIFMAASVWFLLPLASFAVVAGFTGQLGFVITGVISSLIVFVLCAALIGGILNSFSTSAWMYVYMKMHHESVGSKILHWLTWFKRA